MVGNTDLRQRFHPPGKWCGEVLHNAFLPELGANRLSREAHGRVHSFRHKP